MGRAYPDASCEIVFEPREWRTIYMMQYQRRPPDQPPPLQDAIRALAQLGGFLARAGDGEPGIKALWQGYQRLHEFIYAVEMYNGERPASGAPAQRQQSRTTLIGVPCMPKLDGCSYR